MAKQKIKSQFNYVSNDIGKETPEGVSMTIQGESLDIKAILKRSQEGIIPKSIPGIFSEIESFDMPDLEKIRGLDIEEQTQMLREARNKVQLYKGIIDKKKKEEIQKNLKEKAEAKRKANEDEDLSVIPPVIEEVGTKVDTDV